MKTIFSLTLVLLTLGALGQRKEALINFNKPLKKDIEITDKVEFKIDHTNYCLYKFQKENQIAVAAELIGIAALAIGNFDYLNGTRKTTKDYEWAVISAGDRTGRIEEATRQFKTDMEHINDRKEVLTYAGIGLFAAGGILHLASYRWLKRAYVVPSENGIAVQVKF